METKTPAAIPGKGLNLPEKSLNHSSTVLVKRIHKTWQWYKLATASRLEQNEALRDSLHYAGKAKTAQTVRSFEASIFGDHLTAEHKLKWFKSGANKLVERAVELSNINELRREHEVLIDEVHHALAAHAPNESALALLTIAHAAKHLPGLWPDMSIEKIGSPYMDVRQPVAEDHHFQSLHLGLEKQPNKSMRVNVKLTVSTRHFARLSGNSSSHDLETHVDVPKHLVQKLAETCQSAHSLKRQLDELKQAYANRYYKPR